MVNVMILSVRFQSQLAPEQRIGSSLGVESVCAQTISQEVDLARM